MKRAKNIFNYAFLIAILAVINALPAAAQNFEGVIHYEFPDGGRTNNMEYMIKGDKVRWQFGEGQQSGAMLFLPKQSQMVVILDQMHGYMKMDTDEQNEDDDSDYAGEWEGSKMTQTGQTKTIAGHSCEVWKVDGKDGHSLNMCMAEGFGSFMSPGNPMTRQHAPAWARKIAGEGYMPLEVIETENGKTSTKLKATQIEKTAISDDKFEIPDGYKDMSAMMKQMQKMRQHN